ncbi:MAG: DAK2 domain-containing protein [Candidatus Cryosericum sp.]
MAQSTLDLAGLFQSVTQALVGSKDALNQADEYNHDHGTNMVSTFQTITDALKEKQGVSNSEALSYAAEQLKQKGTSGSSQLYAQNLQQAALKMRGNEADVAGVLSLLQTLMGGEQIQEAQQAQASGVQTAGVGGLGGLMGRLMGAVQTQQVQQPVTGSSVDTGLGSLLGGVLGGQTQTQAQAQSGGVGGIMSMITSLLGSGQGGGSGAGLQGLVQAFTGGSATSQSYRQQSSGVVVNTVLQAIMSMMGK